MACIFMDIEVFLKVNLMPHVMIVISPYYKEVSEFLLEGAKSYLDEKHATYEVIEVPGALEIPLAIKLGLARPESRGKALQSGIGIDTGEPFCHV